MSYSKGVGREVRGNHDGRVWRGEFPVKKILHAVIPVRLRSAGRLLSLLMLTAILLGTLEGAIPVNAAPLTQGGVQRITFAPGATSAVVQGAISGGHVAYYVLTAMAGQTMTVLPDSNNGPVYVTIYNTQRMMMGSAASGQVWTGVLPATGDYTLAVYPPSNGAYTNFMLKIQIVSSSQPTPSAPERIYFAPGAVSTTITGYLPSNFSKQYILNARAGQVMTISSWTSNGPFRYTMTMPDGTWLGSGDQGQGWSGTLPTSGDYLITVQTPTDTSGANYGLYITIVNSATPPTPTPSPTPIPPPAVQRISFPSGATSVTVSGYADGSIYARYVLRALRGQTMKVYLTTYHAYPQTVTIRDSRGNFMGSANNGQQWSGMLPATGDYYLDVQAPPGSLGDTFSLYIQIL